ncbi:kinase-like protein [Ceratobasidium sp. AG-I]|nr:kinase-like protein [Ceratobasidium sp. AG-I]
MSAIHSSLSPVVKDITKHVRINRVSEYQYEEAGFGGSADIFCGTYRSEQGSVIKVAIKSIRASNFDGIDPKYEEKMIKKLTRELEIWRTLGRECSNIIELLGVITGIGPLPSPVCELCTWNLQSYLERKTPPPKHIKIMTDTLRGLSYMHELKPDPIAHGDIKSHNILVTADERALICDFGRSRLPHEQRREETQSSPFGATLRYMSPELFVPSVVGPTPASDMWAYGCVALEILCRVQPYQEIVNDYEVVELIRQGHAPSGRPHGARAALVNDTLWTVLAACWREQSWRPTSRAFLERLLQMLQAGEVSTSPVLLDLFPLAVDGPLEPWPEDLIDLKQQVVMEKSDGAMESSLRSQVWLATLDAGRWRKDSRTKVIVKVPRLNVSPQHQEPHNHLAQILRKTLKHRYGVRHRNIIDVLGIDLSFSPHPGLVLEYCAGGNLTTYYKKTVIDTNTVARPSSPGANAYSLIIDILEGLRYMHDYPVPIPQGDLTPESILVDKHGTAKISLFSFGRMISAIPSAAALTASVGPILPFRWMSPELLINNEKPTTESDIWAAGCVSFWILTGLQPYAGHLRDDFAGVESVRGLSPGSIFNIDRANPLIELAASRESSWITNGIWVAINSCWSLDPLQRPNATGFLRVLTRLQGKVVSWMPTNVVDLSGKIEQVNNSELHMGIAHYRTVWK